MKRIFVLFAFFGIYLGCNSSVDDKGGSVSSQIPTERNNAESISLRTIGIRNTHDFDMGVVTVNFSDGTSKGVHIVGKGDFFIVENDPRVPVSIILNNLGKTYLAEGSVGLPITYPDSSTGQFYRDINGKINKVTSDSIPLTAPWYWYIFNAQA